jgi:tetratricopeptide (TPR) repeat protein
MAQQKDRQAIADALSAVAEAKAVGETAALAEAYGVLDISSTFLGLEKPFNYGKAALDLYELLGDITKQASVNTNLGIEAFFAGRWDEALERYERARSFYLRAGNEVQAAATEANISEILLNQGHASQAEELLRHALAIMRAAGLADEEAFAEAQFGRALMDRGDLEGAEKSLRAAVARFEEVGEMQSFQEASAYLGTCLTSSGQPAEARSVIARAREAGEVTVNAPALLLVDAEALEQMGMLEDAFAAAVAAGTEAERQTSPYQEARAVLLRARLARLLGMRADDSESVRANDVLMSLGVSPRFIN